jgi:hypothetical protein
MRGWRRKESVARVEAVVLLVVLVVLSAAMLGMGAQGCSPIECAETATCPGAVPDGASLDDESTAHGENGEAGNDDAGVADAARDVAVGNPRDAGPIEADGEGGAFCASLSPQTTFCDDFDEHPLPGLWTSFTQTGGTLTRDPAAFVSSPNSLLAQDSPLASGQALDTAVRTQFSLPAPPTTIELDFQLQPVQADSDAGAATVVASLDFTDVANNRYTVQFTLVQQGIAALSMRMEEQAGFIDGGSSYTSHPLPDPLDVGTWTSVGLKVNRTAANAATAHVTFGTAAEIDVALAMSVNATSIQLTIGSSYESEPSGGWKDRYDNVVLNVQPPPP